MVDCYWLMIFHFLVYEMYLYHYSPLNWSFINCFKSTYPSFQISSTKNTGNLSWYFSYNSSPDILITRKCLSSLIPPWYIILSFDIGLLSVVYPRDILFLLTLRKDRPYQGTISCAYAHIYIHCYSSYWNSRFEKYIV